MSDLSALPTVATLRQVAAATGIPIWTIRRWVKRGTLLSIQPSGRGGVIRVRVHDVEQLLGTGAAQEAV